MISQLITITLIGLPLTFALALLIGLIVLHLATDIPFVGGLVGFLGLSLGLGPVVQLALRWRRPVEPAPLPATT